MARCRLVKPETVRVSLSDGDYLELKKELNAGEYRDLFVAQLKDTPAGDRMTVDLRNVGISKILAYVVGWSMVDWQDKLLDISRDTVEKLETATYQEMVDAVDAHHEDWEKRVEARKNARGGETSPAPISLSAA